MAVQTPLSLLWDPLTDSSSFPSPQSLPSDWRRNGSDGAGGAQLTTNHPEKALFLLRNEANLPTTVATSFFVMKVYMMILLSLFIWVLVDTLKMRPGERFLRVLVGSVENDVTW
ncbi:hypothetical protein NQZ68_036682 [Dissostichus eleginoides]|nr:hypothetical protein NQZ68_036682 [Dissostichus eleginoides]